MATIFICSPFIRRSCELLILPVWGTISVSTTAASPTTMTASKASVSEISTIIIRVTGKEKYLQTWPDQGSNQRPLAYQSNVLSRRYKSWFLLQDMTSAFYYIVFPGDISIWYHVYYVTT